jgi:hypothetical protein
MKVCHVPFIVIVLQSMDFELTTHTGHTDGVTSLEAHEGVLISGSKDSTIRIW